LHCDQPNRMSTGDAGALRQFGASFRSPMAACARTETLWRCRSHRN
jgi:hypothetical protein